MYKHRYILCKSDMNPAITTFLVKETTKFSEKDFHTKTQTQQLLIKFNLKVKYKK